MFKKSVLLFIIFYTSRVLLIGQGTWSLINSPPIFTPRIGAVTFSIGKYGYFGGGNDRFSSAFHDFWQYNPDSNLWKRKADIPGPERVYAVGFSINGKGYVGTGASATESLKDFYEYQVDSNKWIKKADFPGDARAAGIGLNIANYGYIGFGINTNLKTKEYKDLYKFNPDSNNWMKIPDFPGIGRRLLAGFSLGKVAYIGTGYDTAGNYLNDWWKFNSITNKWTQLKDFSGGKRCGGISFEIDGVGYIGMGNDSTKGVCGDLWQYDSTLDKWTQMLSNSDYKVWRAASFAVDKIAYVGSGKDETNTYRSDFWSYNPKNLGLLKINKSFVKIWPNPTSSEITIDCKFQKNQSIEIFNLVGALVYKVESSLLQSEQKIDLALLPNGIYIVKIGNISQKIVLNHP